MTSTEKVTKLLADLPEDPDLIAEFMRDLGFTGAQRDGCRCPMAVYLTWEGVEKVVVHEDTTRFSDGDRRLRVTMPDHCTEFVKNFDKGAYPFLVEE